MQYERVGHEILTVEQVQTPTQTAIVKRHHTMYAHVRLDAPVHVAVGQDVMLGVRLVRWNDENATVTDYTPMLTITVDGQDVGMMDPVGGVAIVPLQFTDPGTYTITVGCPTVQSATVTIEVVDG